MNLFNQKQRKQISEPNSSVPVLIAEKLLILKEVIAGWVGTRFNRFSKGQQKCVLFIFCFTISGLLLSGLSGSFMVPPAGYTAHHIGQASDIPKPNPAKNQLTDSLTLKSKSWKQN
jgi:hypothetical protein